MRELTETRVNVVVKPKNEKEGRNETNQSLKNETVDCKDEYQVSTSGDENSNDTIEEVVGGCEGRTDGNGEADSDSSSCSDISETSDSYTGMKNSDLLTEWANTAEHIKRLLDEAKRLGEVGSAIEDEIFNRIPLANILWSTGVRHFNGTIIKATDDGLRMKEEVELPNSWSIDDE